jgi:hypothetical protein
MLLQELRQPAETLKLLHACSRRAPEFPPDVIQRIFKATDWSASPSAMGSPFRNRDACAKAMATVAALGLYTDVAQPFVAAVERRSSVIVQGSKLADVRSMLRSCVKGRFRSQHLVEVRGLCPSCLSSACHGAHRHIKPLACAL